MADDGKKTENVCAKVTERMALDLLRAATIDGISNSAYLYRLLRRDLYGRTERMGSHQSEPTSDE